MATVRASLARLSYPLPQHLDQSIMKVLIAPNTFKETLSATAVAATIAEGFENCSADIRIQQSPLSDGGEGFLDAILSQKPGVVKHCEVHNPLGEIITAPYAMISNKTAIVEMAKASGLELVPKDKRNPLDSSSFGTGELIKNAITDGQATDIIVGLGGSAINDAGVGMIQALGGKFLDKHGKNIRPGARHLSETAEIDLTQLRELTAGVRFTGATDVTNPLLGPNGATYIYGPQKGASGPQLAQLEEGLRHISELTSVLLEKSDIEHHGSGAAGGMGYALLTFLKATLSPGFDLVAQMGELDQIIRNVDVVVTGEGQLDEQTFSGKTIQRLVKICSIHGKPVVVICGNSKITTDKAEGLGISKLYTLSNFAGSKRAAMQETRKYLYGLALQLGEDMDQSYKQK